MITTKSNFEWKYVEEGERITLEFEGRQPVYFDATRPRVKKWLKSRHRGGAMHEPVFAFVLTKLGPVDVHFNRMTVAAREMRAV